MSNELNDRQFQNFNNLKNQFPKRIESVLSLFIRISKSKDQILKIEELLKQYESLKKIQLTFTPREKEILKRIKQGQTSIHIAEQLCSSPQTIKTHRKNINKKIKKLPKSIQTPFWIHCLTMDENT